MVNIVITIRYSMLLRDTSAWLIAQKNRNVEDYKTALFQPRRLEAHWSLFSRITLPSLATQITKHHAAVYVLTSTELPEEYKRRLEGVARACNWLRIRYVAPDEPPDLVHNACISEFIGNPLSSGSSYAHLRMDDDDALHSGFLDSLAPYVVPAFCGMVVSFPRGVLGCYNSKTNRFTRFFLIRRPLIAIGLALVGRTDDINNIHQLGGHTTLDERAPVILDARFPLSYIRTVYEEQDSFDPRKLLGNDKPVAAGVIAKHFTISGDTMPRL